MAPYHIPFPWPSAAAVMLLACCAAVTFGCASDQASGIPMRPVRMPQWALTGVHPDYPEEQYIVTYGMARDVREAERLAEELLEVEMTAWPLRQFSHLWANTQFHELVKPPAAWISVAELRQSVQREYATAGFDNVVLCAISRDNLRLWAGALLPRARAQLNEMSEPPAAGTVRDRLERWGEYFLAAARVLALHLIVHGSLERDAFHAAENAAQRLWEIPGVIRTTQVGSGSRVQIRGGLPDELLLYARLRGEPVTGVPLRWQLAPNLRGTLRGDELLNAAGEARCRVLHVSPSGDDSGQAFVSVDLDRLLGRRSGLQMPVWAFNFLLPSRNNSVIVLHVQETIEGAARGAAQQFLPEFRNWARQRNQRLAEQPTGERPYQLKLTGSIELRSQTQNGQPIAYVTGLLELIDLETQQVLFSYRPGVHRRGAPGMAEAAIALGAQREATADALLEVASRITALLPAPDDAVLRR